MPIKNNFKRRKSKKPQIDDYFIFVYSNLSKKFLTYIKKV